MKLPLIFALLFKWRYALLGICVGLHPLRGDGVADNTTALQARIDAAALGINNGVVAIPTGEFRFTRTLRLP